MTAATEKRSNCGVNWENKIFLKKQERKFDQSAKDVREKLKKKMLGEDQVL